MEIQVMANILDKNDQIAAEVNAMLSARGIFVLNLLGSPGSGKTSLLERTLQALQGEVRMAVIEGDLFTSKDADRIARHGVQVVQINTGGGCHLDANMVKNVLSNLDLFALDMIIIENVGNLVCPAEFNVGEDAKAVVLSITEGEDKPLKYPLMFKQAMVAVLNKIDLLPYTDFNLAAATEDIVGINPRISLVTASCRTGEGLEDWYGWLKRQIAEKNKEYVRMNDLVQMQQEIEETRTLLTRLVTANKGDITHPDVAALSAKLDGLIVRYEQMKPEQEKGQKK